MLYADCFCRRLTYFSRLNYTVTFAAVKECHLNCLGKGGLASNHGDKSKQHGIILRNIPYMFFLEWDRDILNGSANMLLLRRYNLKDNNLPLMRGSTHLMCFLYLFLSTFRQKLLLFAVLYSYSPVSHCDLIISLFRWLFPGLLPSVFSPLFVCF